MKLEEKWEFDIKILDKLKKQITIKKGKTK